MIEKEQKFRTMAIKANREKYARQRMIIREAGLREISVMSRGAFKIAGAMMYWAEGRKTQGGTGISNSDPNIILFMVRWFRVFFNVSPDRLKVHLHIHYGNDEAKIKAYWSSLTGIPLHNFGKSFIKPKGTGHRKNILPNGIASIRVLGIGGTDMRRRILAWTEKIAQLSEKHIPSLA